MADARRRTAASNRALPPLEGQAPTHTGRLGPVESSGPIRFAGGRDRPRTVPRPGRLQGRVIRQYFRGRWILAPRGDSWVGARVRLRKTRGGKVHLSKSECPAPKPSPAPAPPTNCQGYSPCLPPGPDVDCAGGSGSGPRYVQGPVYVNGSDPSAVRRGAPSAACRADAHLRFSTALSPCRAVTQKKNSSRRLIRTSTSEWQLDVWL
jgi:hypothetical protein